MNDTDKPSKAAEYSSAPDLDCKALEQELLHIKSSYKEELERSRQLSLLSDATADMLKHESLEELQQFVADGIVRLTSANGAYMHMLHQTGDYLHMIAGCGPLKDQLFHVKRYKGKGLSAEAWEAGETKYTDNFNENYSDVVQFPVALKAVAIPLKFADRILGVVFVTSEMDSDLKSQIPFLEEIAKISSLGIYHTEQKELAERELHRMKSLSALGDFMIQCTDWRQVMEHVGAHLHEIFDAHAVWIFRDENGNGELETFSMSMSEDGVIVDHTANAKSISVGRAANWSYKHKELAQINRRIRDSRESELIYNQKIEQGLGSSMCIPLLNNETVWGVIEIARKNDKPDFDESDISTLYAVASQISTVLQRNDLISRVKYQAEHDSLTDLPNRRSFERQLKKIIEHPNQESYAVLFCDLDGFKEINDTHGHAVGDVVIKFCVERLSNCLRGCDYFARMGGDEFAILVKCDKLKNQGLMLAERLVNTLQSPLNVKGLHLNLGLSVGISYFPEDGTSTSELLSHSDMAMYQAKYAGNRKVQVFNRSDAEKLKAKNELRAALYKALPRNEFQLVFQPQVQCGSGSVIGVEALIRWRHPELGLISPVEFIPIAEESGLICDIGRWVLNETLKSLQQWNTRFKRKLVVGVNIATPQFVEEHFASDVIAMLQQYDVDPSQLEIEVTESFIMHDKELVVSHLTKLRDHGVKVAVDDFGTGYSSLSYLKDLPLDVLKVDRSFVNDLTEENYEESLASSIIALAESMGLSTIAEGVETEEQLKLIELLGCEQIQGYYYSKPVDAKDLLSVIHGIEEKGDLDTSQSLKIA